MSDQYNQPSATANLFHWIASLRNPAAREQYKREQAAPPPGPAPLSPADQESLGKVNEISQRIQKEQGINQPAPAPEPEQTDEQIVQDHLRKQGLLDAKPPVAAPTPAPRREAQPGELDMAMERPAPEPQDVGPPEPARAPAPPANPLADRSKQLDTEEGAAIQDIKDNPYGKTRRDKWSRALAIMGAALTDAGGKTSGALGSTADRYSNDTKIAHVQAQYHNMRDALMTGMALEQAGMNLKVLESNFADQQALGDPNSPVSQAMWTQAKSANKDPNLAQILETPMSARQLMQMGLTSQQQLERLQAQVKLSNEIMEGHIKVAGEARAEEQAGREKAKDAANLTSGGERLSEAQLAADKETLAGYQKSQRENTPLINAQVRQIDEATKLLTSGAVKTGTFGQKFLTYLTSQGPGSVAGLAAQSWMSPQERQFMSIMKGIAGSMRQQINGPGVATDRDMARLDEVVASLADSPQVAVQKLQELRQAKQTDLQTIEGGLTEYRDKNTFRDYKGSSSGNDGWSIEEVK